MIRNRIWFDKFYRGWVGPYPFTIDGVLLAEEEAVPASYPTFYSVPVTELEKVAPKAQKVPKTNPFSGVYQIIENDVVLYVDKDAANPDYVGIASKSVFARLRRHVRGTGNKPAGRAAKTGNYSFVYWLCDHKSAQQIESKMLVDESPQFNQKIEWLNYIANITVH